MRDREMLDGARERDEQEAYSVRSGRCNLTGFDHDHAVELEALRERRRHHDDRSVRFDLTWFREHDPACLDRRFDLGDPFRHRDHRDRCQFLYEVDRVVRDLIDELVGRDQMEVGVVTVGAHRPRRSDAGSGRASNRFASDKTAPGSR